MIESNYYKIHRRNKKKKMVHSTKDEIKRFNENGKFDYFPSITM